MKGAGEVEDRVPLRIAHVVSSIEAEASGPSYTVPSLARALARSHQTVSLLTLGQPSIQQTGSFQHIRFQNDIGHIPVFSKLGMSRSMRRHLETGAFEVIHTHGLWMMPNVYPSELRSHPPVVLSPRGMLSPAALSYSPNRKKVFWALKQKSAAQKVSCFHATSEQEYHDIRAYGLTQPVAVLPNGIDVTDTGVLKTKNKTVRRVLFLGRLHPIKRLDALITSWSQIETSFPDWELSIQGPSEPGYRQKLESLAQSLGVRRCTFGDALYGADKEQAFIDADLYVLPSATENFAMTVAESLVACTPVIATKGTPWSGLVEHRCGWWIDHGVDPLTFALREAMSLPSSELQGFGVRGRQWMQQDFSWDAIAGAMSDVYEWMCRKGSRPLCVRVN